MTFDNSNNNSTLSTNGTSRYVNRDVVDESPTDASPGLNISVIIVIAASVAIVVMAVLTALIVVLAKRRHKRRGRRGDKLEKAFRMYDRIAHENIHSPPPPTGAPSNELFDPVQLVLGAECQHPQLVTMLLLKAAVMLWCLQQDGRMSANPRRILCSVSTFWRRTIRNSTMTGSQMREFARKLSIRRQWTKFLARSHMSVERIQRTTSPGEPFIHCLGTNLLQRLVMKSFVLRYTEVVVETRKAASEVVMTLCAVSSVWWLTIDIMGVAKRLKIATDKRICAPYRRRPRIIRTLSSDLPVMAVAHFDDKIFVISKSSKLIAVFDDSTDALDPLRGIALGGAKDPSDIVAWRQTDRLYVADAKCVWKINVKGPTVKKWLPKKLRAKEKFEPRSLSVTRKFLAVATADFAVRFYGPKGSHVRTAALGDYLDPTCTVVVRHPAIVLACFGSGRGYADCDRLPSLQVQIFERRFSVAFDDDGRGFFADHESNDVFLMSPAFRRRCMLGIGATEPRKLCYVQKNGRLMVCDGKAVKIYAVLDSQSAAI